MRPHSVFVTRLCWVVIVLVVDSIRRCRLNQLLYRAEFRYYQRTVLFFEASRNGRDLTHRCTNQAWAGLPYQKKQLIVAKNQVAYPPIHPQMIFYSWPKSLNKTIH